MGILTLPLPTIIMVWFLPDRVKISNFFWLIPTFLIYPLIRIMHKTGWTPAAIRVYSISSYSHAAAIWHTLRGRTAEWVPTGETRRTSMTSKVTILLVFWMSTTNILMITGALRFWILRDDPVDIAPVLVMSVLNAFVWIPIARLAYQERQVRIQKICLDVADGPGLSPGDQRKARVTRRGLLTGLGGLLLGGGAIATAAALATHSHRRGESGPLKDRTGAVVLKERAWFGVNHPLATLSALESQLAYTFPIVGGLYYTFDSNWSRHVSELLPAAGRELMVAWMPQLPQSHPQPVRHPRGQVRRSHRSDAHRYALLPGACRLPLGARAERQLVLLVSGGRARRNADAVHRGLALHRGPRAGDGWHVQHPVVLVSQRQGRAVRNRRVHTDRGLLPRRSPGSTWSGAMATTSRLTWQTFDQFSPSPTPHQQAVIETVLDRRDGLP